MNTVEFLKPYVKQQDTTKDWFLSDNYYIHYYNLGLQYHPQNILEIGVRYGYSLLNLLKGSLDRGIKEFEVIGIDFQDEINSNKIAIENIEKFSKIWNCQVNFQVLDQNILILKSDDFEKNRFDMIHLDANHSYIVLHEIQTTWQSLKNSGILVIDDVGSFESWNDWIRTKRTHIENFFQRYISFNQVESIQYLNTFRGTFIVKKSKTADKHGKIT